MGVPHKKWLVAFAFFVFLGLTIYALLGSFRHGAPRILEDSNYIIYVPSHIGNHVQYPLVIVLSPSGDARQMINAWKNVSERFKWVVLSSKRFHNGIPGEEVWTIFNTIATSVKKGMLPVPIDKKRVIASGLSGGGMGSHMFSFYFPETICGVIVNTGMIDAEYFYPKKNDYPRKKIAVFLASPTDFRYSEMMRDYDFLKGLDWETKWIEFKGGHVLAPQDVYFQAVQWISDQWKGS